MSVLAANLIADMKGPVFLQFYGVVIVGTLVLLWFRLRALDASRELPPMKIPAQLDPYEVAFLRGGEPEVVRLTLVSLIQRGYLQASGTDEDQISRAAKPPNVNYLEPAEREVYDWFSAPLEAKDIFAREAESGKFKLHCANYEGRLLQESLLQREEVKTRAVTASLLAALFLVGLGGYKLSVAMSRGKSNLAGLFFLGFVSVVGVVVVCAINSRRISGRGRNYLEALQATFSTLKAKVATAAKGNADSALLLLVGVYGISVLAETTYGFFPKMFQRAAAANSGSSCGSSCGSASSCGSSGDSGGGGGCGGCGGGGD